MAFQAASLLVRGNVPKADGRVAAYHSQSFAVRRYGQTGDLAFMSDELLKLFSLGHVPEADGSIGCGENGIAVRRKDGAHDCRLVWIFHGWMAQLLARGRFPQLERRMAEVTARGQRFSIGGKEHKPAGMGGLGMA